MRLLLALLALISAGPVAADCPKAADWARAFYSEHYLFYGGAPDPILQFTTPDRRLCRGDTEAALDHRISLPKCRIIGTIHR